MVEATILLRTGSSSIFENCGSSYFDEGEKSTFGTWECSKISREHLYTASLPASTGQREINSLTNALAMKGRLHAAVLD
jgi:hypothetical protein